MGGCGTVTLTQNYRSTGSIVGAATAVIKRNPKRIDKQVTTSQPLGDKVEVCECRNAACEADLVVSRLKEIVEAGGSLADVAVLYRTHAVGRGVYQGLKEHRIPTASSSADTFARPDVQPLMSALRVLTNPEDDAAFRTVATATKPPLDTPLMSLLVCEAVRVGSSLFAAARSLQKSISVLARDVGGGSCASSSQSSATALSQPSHATPRGGGVLPPPRLTPQQQQTVQSLLTKIDNLRSEARVLPPSQLLAQVMRSGLLSSLNPNNPPHGAKLLADELTSGVVGGDAPPTPRRSLPGGSQGSQMSVASAGGRAMPPPANVTDRLNVLKAFLEHQALSEHEQAGGGGGGRPVGVTLSTIHGAKGREWPVVIVMRVNEETLPLSSPSDDDGDGCSPEQLAEERRLLYVAMTRARRRLILSFIAVGADKVPIAKSRFLSPLPMELVEYTTHYELQNACKDTGGAAFAQPTPRGGGRAYNAPPSTVTTPAGSQHGGSSSHTPGPMSRAAPETPAGGGVATDPKPTGAMANNLKKWQREDANRRQKAQLASAKKAERAAKQADKAAGGETAGGTKHERDTTSADVPPPKKKKATPTAAVVKPSQRRNVLGDDDSDDDDLFQ